MAIKVSAKEIFFVYSDRNLTLSEVLYWKDMHSEVKLCLLKSTVVWTRKDQFKPGIGCQLRAPSHREQIVCGQQGTL